MPEKTDHELLLEVHDILLGVNGNPGLCHQVANNTKQINRLWIAIVAVSVSVGSGAFAVVKALLGG